MRTRKEEAKSMAVKLKKELGPNWRHFLYLLLAIRRCQEIALNRSTHS